MNEEEILNSYCKLIDKGYCEDCNELNCLGNFPQTEIVVAIRNLQQELSKYKEANKKAIEYVNGATITENTNTYIKNLLEILEEVSDE